MVARRNGVERYFDLPARVVPPGVFRRAADIDPKDADEALLTKYVRAHRVFDLRDGTSAGRGFRRSGDGGSWRS
jgi:uncharacterized protein YcaQ